MNPIESVIKKYQDNEGKFCWPDAADERNKLASNLLGAKLAANLDYWMKAAQEVIRNSEASNQYRRETLNWENAEPFRKAFASMTDEQRILAEKLLWKTASGVIHSMLVTLDQFPVGLIDVLVLNPDTEEKIANISEAETLDLHDRFYCWLTDYSETSKEYEPELYNNESP
jgi:hypothetical protein